MGNDNAIPHALTSSREQNLGTKDTPEKRMLSTRPSSVRTSRLESGFSRERYVDNIWRT